MIETSQKTRSRKPRPRSASAFDTTAGVGGYPEDMDCKKAYTLKFVDKKVGMRPD